MSTAESIQRIQVCGYELIFDPMLNKGSGFTPRERSELGLHGLLPSEPSSPRGISPVSARPYEKRF